MFEKIEREAMAFALEAHGSQRYGAYPYSYHLYNVVQVLKTIDTIPEVIQAAWLHDVLEDCPKVKYNDVKVKFGVVVAELVYAVTDEVGRNRRERKEKTWPKLAGNEHALTVKLADITANVEDAVTDSPKHIQMYQKEYPEFCATFGEHKYDSHKKLWKRIDDAFEQSRSQTRKAG